jgi:hypothetical protein
MRNPWGLSAFMEEKAAQIVNRRTVRDRSGADRKKDHGKRRGSVPTGNARRAPKGLRDSCHAVGGSNGRAPIRHSHLHPVISGRHYDMG